MAELKTRRTGASVKEFISRIPDAARRKDCLELIDIMRNATGEAPRMWGPSIIGFGSYHYKYASGHEGDAGLAGFASRKPDLVVYITTGVHRYPDLLARLGKHRTGKVCLYIRRLSDVDMKVLKQMIATSVKDMRLASAGDTPTDATRAHRAAR